jgi:hypothetical protein
VWEVGAKQAEPLDVQWTLASATARSVAVAPKDAYVAVGLTTGDVSLFELQSGRLLHTMRGIEGARISSLFFSPSAADGSPGTLLAQGGDWEQLPITAVLLELGT